MSALKQLQKAVKWDNRANAAIHIVSNLKSILKVQKIYYYWPDSCLQTYNPFSSDVI